MIFHPRHSRALHTVAMFMGITLGTMEALEDFDDLLAEKGGYE